MYHPQFPTTIHRPHMLSFCGESRTYNPTTTLPLPYHYPTMCHFHPAFMLVLGTFQSITTDPFRPSLPTFIPTQTQSKRKESLYFFYFLYFSGAQRAGDKQFSATQGQGKKKSNWQISPPPLIQPMPLYNRPSMFRESDLRSLHTLMSLHWRHLHMHLVVYP